MKVRGFFSALCLFGLAACTGGPPAAAPAAAAAGAAVTRGIIVTRREYEAADLAAVPGATSLDDYFSRFPAGAPMRTPMIPQRHMAEFTVKTDDGREVQVNQETAPDLKVGARVQVGTAAGKPVLTVLP